MQAALAGVGGPEPAFSFVLEGRVSSSFGVARSEISQPDPTLSPDRTRCRPVAEP
jgi:hypothetical protein